MRIALGAMAAGLWALTITGGHAQQPAVAQVVVGGVQLDGTNGAASVTVLDAAGNPVGGLAQGAFTVQVDGQAVQVQSATSELNNALPLGVILTMDTSGSMAEGGRLEAAKSAVRPLVEALQPDDRMALVIFANGVQTLVQPTADKAELNRYITALTPVGNTALYAATTQSAALALGLAQPRKAVVILSDGEEFGNVSGGITRDQALAAAASSNVPFFVVGLGQVDLPYLTQLAAPADGQLFTTANPAQLAALYDRIAQRLRVQYTVRFAVPSNLQPGEHKLTVSADGRVAETTFTIAGEISSGSNVAFQGLGAELREKTIVSLSNLPSTARVNWLVDGQAVSGAGDGRSIELDPYTFPPGGSHTLVASYDPSDPTKRVTATFRVPALPPRVVSPNELPNLAPGDLVRLEVMAQPGVPVTAIYKVDGNELERDTEPPYEFVLPAEDYEEGDHQLTVVLEGARERGEKSYKFEGPAGASTNYGAYGIIAIAALAVLAGAGYGGRLAFERYRTRSRPVDLSGVAPALQEWARAHRAADEEGDQKPAAIPVAAPPPGAWGSFVVVEAARKGDKLGTRWSLNDETELVGRGKFCSVRLKDRAIEDAHFVITREAQLHASTPACRVEVGGESVRRAKLADGALVKLGGTTLQYEAAKSRA